MLHADVDELLKKSVLADPEFHKRTRAPSREEDLRLRKEKREYRATHLEGWYNMRKINPRTDSDIRKDLKLIQYRNFLVDDRIYRRPEKADLPQFAEVGTVVCDDLISSQNLPKSKRSKSLYDEWMKSDRLKKISDTITPRDIIEQGSSTLSQPTHAFTLQKSSRKTPVQKKAKFSKRKITSDSGS